MTALFEALHLRKRYGETTVVDGVSFAIAPGECLGVIGPNGAGKTTTIRMCLGLTVPDGGAVHFTPQPGAAPLHMPRDARDLVALFAPIVDADRRRIDLRLARRLPDEMRSDPARIRQILFNLVSNASRHTTVGNVTLAVHRGRNGRIVFDVLDDGPGLPPDFRFRPFARGSGPKAGSGLGLWISARLAAALGGRLTMTARPEGGTRARLTLPASPQPARPPRRAARQAASPAQLPAAPLAAAPAAPAEAPGPLAGLSALVVDDSAVSRMLMTTILGSFGLAVTTADDSAEATAHCVRRAPDLIFVDWTLRGETGAAVIEHIAAVCGARPPAVLITAETRISAEGFAARVRKPFSPRELYDATLTALGAATRDAAHGA